MIAIGAFYKLQYFAVLMIKTNASRTPTLIKTSA
jgi:hypothetical protein